MGQSVRLFVALTLTDAVCQALESPLQAVQDAVPPRLVRWTPIENIHLTLKFLGDVSTTQVNLIRTALEKTVQGFSPLSIGIQGVGCFPNTKRPRIVWVGLDEPTGQLLALRDSVEKYIAPLGYPTEGRDFTPHLTIGRVKKEITPPELGKLGSAIQNITLGHIATWECTTMNLMQSDLQPQGARYTSLQTITLA